MIPRALLALALAFGGLFLAAPASGACVTSQQSQTIAATIDATTAPEVTTLETCGGDDTSYQVPLTVAVTFDGQQFDSVYATTNSVITFGRPDGTYWDYPQTPSISLYSMDWVVYPNQRADEHLTILASDGGFQVDISARPIWLQSAPEATNINIVAAINIDGTVAISYSLTGPDYADYNWLRTGVRLTDGSVVSLEQYGIVQVEEAPVLTPEPVAPTPNPTPESTPEPTPEVTPEPVVTPTPEPTVEPTPEPTPEPMPQPVVPEPTPEPVVPTPEPVRPEPEVVVPPAPIPKPEPVIPPVIVPPVEPTLPPVVEPEPPVIAPEPPVIAEPAHEPVPEPPVIEPTPPTPEPEPPVVAPEPPLVEPEPPLVEPQPPVIEPEPIPVAPQPKPEPVLAPKPIVAPAPPVEAPKPVEPPKQPEIKLDLKTIDPATISPVQQAVITQQAEAVLATAEQGSPAYEQALKALAVIAEADDPELPAELAAIPLLGNVAGAVMDTFNSIGNIGADISPAEREKGQKIVVGTIIVGQMASVALLRR